MRILHVQFKTIDAPITGRKDQSGRVQALGRHLSDEQLCSRD